MDEPANQPVGTILVADDEESIRWVLERACSQHGHAVTAVGTGTEALSLLKARAFDVALLDIKMPDLSGLDVLSQARTAGVETLFIVMTAQNTMANAIEATKRGAASPTAIGGRASTRSAGFCTAKRGFTAIMCATRSRGTAA